MGTDRGFERIINFSDATVAIAMTLLVLPLVDVGRELTQPESVFAVLGVHAGEVVGFLLSFFVIWVLWMAHHGTLEHFRSYDAVILRIHVIWLLTIVVLPFTTQLLTNSKVHPHGALVLYVLNLVLSSLMLQLMSWHGRQKPDLLRQDREEVRAWLAAPLSWVTFTLFCLVFVVVLLVPGLGAWPLFLLFLQGPIESGLAHRRSARRGA
jgi:uncharacterized membrane protein